jgi:hypothetical protein
MLGIPNIFKSRPRAAPQGEMRHEPTLEKQGAAQLPPIIVPKVPNKSQGRASFSKRSKTASGDQRLVATDRRTANIDLLSLRNGTNTKATIRDLAKVSPDLSASVNELQASVKASNQIAITLTGDVALLRYRVDALEPEVRALRGLLSSGPGPVQPTRGNR